MEITPAGAPERLSFDELTAANEDLTDFEVFRLGLEELLYLDADFGSLARAMGVPYWDENHESAYVTYEPDKKQIVFAANPAFLRMLTVDECAAVIAHETYHCLFEHLNDLTDPTYPDHEALIKAQECIINDTVDSVLDLPLPPVGVLRGMDIVGEDCTHLTTRAVYDKLAREQEDSDGGDSGEGQANGPSISSGEGGGSSAEGGAGEGQPADSPSDSAGSSSGDSMPGCGGVRISEDDAGAAADAFEKLLETAADDQGCTKQELIEALTNSAPGGYSPTGASLTEQVQYSAERMNWRELLARINPKVLESGKKARSKSNWTRYNRRMSSVYPKVILPVRETVDPTPKEKGDSIPVMVIALDLSGSIDRSLVKMLQGLLTDIPEDLIRAFPCTWASNLLPYTPGGRVAGGGTSIHLVSRYVEQVAQETGTDPYVLVITDGEFTRDFKRPGKDWFFMGVDAKSVRTIASGQTWGYGPHVKPGETVYSVNEFRV